MKFYPSDWRSDPALRSCTIAARGLWIEMLAIMHEAEPYGSLLVKGKRPDKKRLASLVGIAERECTVLLLELEGFRVFERDSDGTIYSRRMRRDHARSEEGRKQVSKRWGNRNEHSEPISVPNRSDGRSAITQKPEARIDDDGTARARSLISREAQELADELLVIAGHKLEFVPPGWCGAAMRVQAWLAEWPREVILIAVKAAAARKRGPPAATVDYFQNAVAEEFARQSAPLPKFEISEVETITVTHGKSQARSGNSLLATLDRAIAAAELAQDANPSLPADSILRIPDRSIC